MPHPAFLSRVGVWKLDQAYCPSYNPTTSLKLFPKLRKQSLQFRNLTAQLPHLSLQPRDSRLIRSGAAKSPGIRPNLLRCLGIFDVLPKRS